MNQQTLELPVPRVANTLPIGEPAEALVRMWDEAERTTVARIPLTPPVRRTDPGEAAKACEALFCCADNDAARLATAIIATLYHKVLVDIGTGICYRGASRGGSESREERQSETRTQTTRAIPSPWAPSPALRMMGADVRLILPGGGCLLCSGHLTNYHQAVEDLCNHRPLSALQREWGQQRAGSLRTLNQLAAALGVQMLQDLVAERLEASTWAQVNFDEAGRLRVLYPQAPPTPDPPACALCAKAGQGDEGLR
jgi:hypothetical protein